MSIDGLFYLSFVERVVVVEAVLGVEVLDDALDHRRGDLALRDVRPQLEALAVIAAFREALVSLPFGRDAVVLQVAPAFRHHLRDERVDAAHGVGVDVGEGGDK